MFSVLLERATILVKTKAVGCATPPVEPMHSFVSDKLDPVSLCGSNDWSGKLRGSALATRHFARALGVQLTMYDCVRSENLASPFNVVALLGHLGSALGRRSYGPR